MCCFSRPVRHVADTEIFCRMGEKGNQVVVYSMQLDAAEELAMILPIPVHANSTESAVKFLDFSGYADFFVDLNRHFRQRGSSFGPDAPRAANALQLKVQRVGNFDASFVPTVADFPRLDARFRLPLEVWQGLPEYGDFGFVVFKLRAGEAKVHPMAFAFPSRNSSKIVFPTVHIHDGKVHKKAGFDHALYVQEPAPKVRMEWEESERPAMRHMNIPATKGAVRPEHHIYRKTLKGMLKNEDVVIDSNRTRVA